MRLLYAVLLNAVALFGAYRFARRHSSDLLQIVADTLLNSFATQYVAVMLPGVLHFLCPFSIAGTAAVISGWLIWRSRAQTSESIATGFYDLDSPSDRRVILVGTLFVAGCLMGWVWLWSTTVLSATDALTYHFPAAIQWLREGRISLVPTWFFNPANTYSPLAGSAFIAWWIAPMRSDTLARFVQVPPLLLIFVAGVRISRQAGVRAVTSVILTAAAILSRPLLSEAVLGKDDLYEAAFFAAAAMGCTGLALRDRWGGWRVGIAVGLMLATKYTAVLTLPLLLLIIDAPLAAGWRWKRWGIAAGAAVVIAGPWFLRNAILTGNPVYPIDVNVLGHRVFAGLFTTKRAEELRSMSGVVRVLTAGFFAIPMPLAILLAVGLLAAVVGEVLSRLKVPPAPTPAGGLGETKATGQKKIGGALSAENSEHSGLAKSRAAMRRLCTLGPLIGLAAFVLTAPYAEVRFLIPSILLTFLAVGIAIEYVSRGIDSLAYGLAATVLAVSLATTHNLKELAPEMVAIGTVGTTIVCALIALWPRVKQLEPARRRQIIGGSVVAVSLGVAGLIYVEWNGYVLDYRLTLDPADPADKGFWDYSYVEGAAWRFIRREVPTGSTIAYANTFLTYPLLDFEFDRRAVYVPARADIANFSQLHRIEKTVSGNDMEVAFSRQLNEQPDNVVWLQRLRAAGAQYLYVVKNAHGGRAPELDMATADPRRFVLLYDDPSGSVFRIEPW